MTKPENKTPGLCEVCGAAFVGNRGRRFCSTPCRSASRQTPETKERRRRRQQKAVRQSRIGRRCKLCNEPISPELNANTKYCSEYCRELFKVRKRRGKDPYETLAYVHGPGVTCAECGASLAGYQNTAKYCSHRCRHEHTYEPKVVELNPPDAVCIGCGVSLAGTLAKRQWCSSSCYARNRYVPVEPKEIVCAGCGRPFVSSYAYARYCGRGCKRKHHKKILHREYLRGRLRKEAGLSITMLTDEQVALYRTVLLLRRTVRERKAEASHDHPSAYAP